MTRAIHQLLPVLSYGDAIGGATLRTQSALRRLGYRSGIYAGLIDSRVADGAHPAAELFEPGAVDRDDAVIYRLSLGSALAQAFKRLACNRVLWFHNITPPEYYRPVNDSVAYWTERGWRDLRDLAPGVDGIIADSTFNLTEAQLAGGGRGWVVPIFDISRLKPRVSRPTSPPILLFVGRVAPSKRHEDLIRAVAALRATSVPDARLVMLGSADDCDLYIEALRVLMGKLGVEDAVELSGIRSTDAEVADAYASASAFVSASDHEGFCVPLLEAMAFGLPVVAHAAGAVPETSGAAALLLDTKDPLVWAEALARVIGDEPLRGGLIRAGRARLAEFDEQHMEKRLRDALMAMELTL